MKQDTIETFTGLVVIIIAIIFFKFAYNMNFNSADNNNSYILKAKFDSIEGINIGSDVMISGVKVGSVQSIVLDNETFSAVVFFKIINNIKLAIDTRVSIITNGIIGGRYISITPGVEDEVLNNNDTIKYTQSSMNLESLVSKFLYSTNNKQNN